MLKGFLLYFPIFFLINRANHSLIRRLWATLPLVLHVFGKTISKYLHKAVHTGNERTHGKAKEFHMLAHVGQSFSCGCKSSVHQVNKNKRWGLCKFEVRFKIRYIGR